MFVFGVCEGDKRGINIVEEVFIVFRVQRSDAITGGVNILLELGEEKIYKFVIIDWIIGQRLGNLGFGLLDGKEVFGDEYSGGRGVGIWGCWSCVCLGSGKTM